jgi:hypothetical protein
VISSFKEWNLSNDLHRWNARHGWLVNLDPSIACPLLTFASVDMSSMMGGAGGDFGGIDFSKLGGAGMGGMGGAGEDEEDEDEEDEEEVMPGLEGGEAAGKAKIEEIN